MKISEDQMDALKETLNISAGQSASAISNLLGCKVNMSVPEIRIVKVGKLYDVISEETKSYVSFFASLEGTFKGIIIMAYDQQQKNKFTCIVLKRFGVNMEEGYVLEEVSNIVFGSFVAGISNFIGITINFDPPRPLEDINQIPMPHDSVAIVGEVVLKPEINGEIKSKIIVIPSNEAVLLLLDKLRGMIG